MHLVAGHRISVEFGIYIVESVVFGMLNLLNLDF